MFRILWLIIFEEPMIDAAHIFRFFPVPTTTWGSESSEGADSNWRQDGANKVDKISNSERVC